MKSLELGSVLVSVGIAVSVFHINLLLVNRNRAPKVAYGVGLLGGVVLLNIGSNLIASSLRQV